MIPKVKSDFCQKHITYILVPIRERWGLITREKVIYDHSTRPENLGPHLKYSVWVSPVFVTTTV